MSADEELGYVYLPFSTPSNDFYGGQRPGNGLFGESLVCLDARTGKRIWHFQMVHHGLWDYDLPAAPNLIDIRVNGTLVKAVAQVSKQGFVYVFDRVTGDRSGRSKSDPFRSPRCPARRSSRTQPFPTKPAPFDRQGVTEDDVIDFTPELRKEALAVLAKYNYGPLFTPPSLEKPTIQMPGYRRRRELGGRGVRPRDRDHVRTVDHEPVRGHDGEVDRRPACRLHRGARPHGDAAGRAALEATVRAHHRHRSQHGRASVDGADGRPADHPRLKPLGLAPLGRPTRGHTLLTKTLLIVGQEGTTPARGRRQAGGSADFAIQDPKLRAYDKATGQGGRRSGAAAQRHRGADDLHAEGTAVHRRADRRRQPAGGADRVEVEVTNRSVPEMRTVAFPCGRWRQLPSNIENTGDF